jgi:glycosyltransferase involved in cell wall biosynthesis
MGIVCFGPGPKFKGGISNYNTSLAKAFDSMGVTTHIVSWTQQYPAIIPREFVDKKSKVDFLEGTNIQVTYITNYNNPLSWYQTYKYIVSLRPEKVIFQWSIAIQGLPLAYIAHKLKKHRDIEVIFDLHFVIQKEESVIDRKFTKMGIKHADTYIAHSYKTVDELKELFSNQNFTVTETGKRSLSSSKTVIKLFHPVYDLFKVNPDLDVEAFKRDNHIKKHAFLFFGFIRKYKGLHHTIEAFKLLCEKRNDVTLMICGESFWNTLDENKWTTKLKRFLFEHVKKALTSQKEDESKYNPLALIDLYNLRDHVFLVNDFIPNEDVHKYFQVADCGVLFYEFATPSGVESLNYNFKLPILATNVGHFPETIKDGFNGYLCRADDVKDMAAVMEKFIHHPIDRQNVSLKAEDMSWKNYALAILNT